MKEDIIFFEQLGFGWVVDARVIRSLFGGSHRRRHIADRLLLERVQRDKSPAR